MANRSSARKGDTIELPLRVQRWAALKAAGLKHEDLVARLAKKGKTVARSSVGAVLNGKYSNDDIEKEFCLATGTERSVMFPRADA